MNTVAIVGGLIWWLVRDPLLITLRQVPRAVRVTMTLRKPSRIIYQITKEERVALLRLWTSVSELLGQLDAVAADCDLTPLNDAYTAAGAALRDVKSVLENMRSN